MRIPRYLRKGDTIAFTAPSCGCASEPALSYMHDAKRVLEKRGYKVVIGQTCYEEDGKGISTDPQVCANEFMDFYLDPKVAAIFAAGGGETMCETISYIDFKRLKHATPKWFIGISDNTNLCFTLATLCKTAAIYGPVVPDFRRPLTRREEDSLGIMEGAIKSVHGYERYADPATGYTNLETFEKYHQNRKKVLHSYLPENGKLKEVKNSHITMDGILLGGCLDVLVNLCGTRFDKVEKFTKHKDIIWVLEACDLTVMGIRRAMWELKEAGWLESTAGFLIGHPLAAFNYSNMGVDHYNAVTDIVEEFGVPVIMDVDVGHINPNMPLVIGVNAHIEVDTNDIEVTMKF